MSISRTQFTSGQLTTTSLAVPFTSNNTAGNLLVITAAFKDVIGNFVSLTDSAGNTIVQANAFTRPAFAGALSTAVFYVLNAKAGANTVTLKVAASVFCLLTLTEYSNTAGTWGFDTAVNGGTNANNGASIPITTTHDHCLVEMSAYSIAGSTTFVAGSGFTVFAGAANAQPGMEDDFDIGLAGPYTIVGTIGGGSSWGATASAFFTNTFSISGNAGTPGATVSWSGAASGSTVADGSGNYTIPSLANGSYVITPSKAAFTFSPTNSNQTVSNANISGVNFVATSVVTVYSVPDCRVAPFGPNTSRTVQGTKIYDVQTSSNPAVPGTDSRAAGAVVDSRVAAIVPQNSRTPGTFGPGE